MKGQLREHPLVELVREINAAGLSGVLRLARERVKAVVYFNAGEAVFAATNLRAHRLTFLLRQWGAVAPERLLEAGVDALSDELAGAALVSSGAVSAEELAALRLRQSGEALRPPLLWTEGEWAFDPRARLQGVAHAPLPAGQMLLEAARRLPAEFVAARFPDRGESVSRPGQLSADLPLQPEEGFVISRLDAPLRVSELAAMTGLPEEQTLRAVYTLFLYGLLRRERAPVALDAAQVAQALAAQAVEPKESAPPVSVEQPREEPAAEEETDPLAALDTLFARAAGHTHYEVLGVGRSVPPAEIKRAYYALARRFHPDRFSREADAELRARIESAFARIAKAYDVLSDPKARAAYDLRLGRTPDASGGQRQQQREQRPDASAGGGDGVSGKTAGAGDVPPGAEEKFRQGQEALRQNDHEAAARLLGEAAMLAPQQARYRAYHGRALAHNRRMRRLAETELQAAVALDPRAADYRVMLAELYRDIGLRRRAEEELERALTLNPTHAEARRLLRSLRES
ncbi:MAG TPA: DnaJ domain-containing protein [Pyrinomonadaceae bacterium]